MRGPMIAEVTAGWLMTKASAMSMSVMPGLLGEHRELLGRVQLALVVRQGHVEVRRQDPTRAATALLARPCGSGRDRKPPASGLHGMTPMP